MEKEQGIILPIIMVVIFVALLSTAGYFAYKQYSTPKESAGVNNNQNIVGGDRDEHGCIGSAGYSWCEAKQKCLRTWEEPCETATIDQTVDLNQVALKIVSGWLDQYKSSTADLNERLIEYKINSVNASNFDKNNQCFRFSVDFSVKTIGGQSNWIAGNGKEGIDNWINNKSLYFAVVKKDSNTYEIIDGGTGGVGEDCYTPSKYFNHFIFKILN